MHSLRQLLSHFRSRPRAHFALAFFAVANQLSVVSVAAAPAVLSVPALQAARSACEPESGCATTAPSDDSELSLPAGRHQCLDSGPAAACETTMSAGDAAPGIPMLPDGQAACAPIPDKPVPTTSAACSDTPLPPMAARSGGAEPSPAVMPSVPMAQFGPQGPTRVALRADSETLAAGLQATLSATASSSVSGTNLAIEVFDETSHALVAACPRGSQCTVSYAAASGVHNFVAFVTPPTTQIPSGTII